jgi:dTDP-4-amino-4,6-dideoxygalactose transaminase
VLKYKMIPFNRPLYLRGAIKNVKSVSHLGHFSGDGHYDNLVNGVLKEITNSTHSLLTPSCTHSLELALRLMNLKPGDEVILPDWTFTSAATAIVSQGATPVFVDSNRNPPNISASSVSAAINSKTRALIVMHYGGIGFEMELIEKLCKEKNIALIEDNAHGLGSKYLDRPLGSFGDMATYSFHETKNFQCGEGGAITFNSRSLFDRAVIIREKGTNRSQFLEGKIEKYQWVENGSSYLLAEPLSAILYSSLINFKYIQNRRKKIWQAYQSAFETNFANLGIDVPNIGMGVNHSSHIYYLILQDKETRKAFIQHMNKKSVQVVFHYQSLWQSTAGQFYGKLSGKNTNSRQLSDCLVRLPLYPQLRNFEVNRIIDGVLDFCKNI